MCVALSYVHFTYIVHGQRNKRAMTGSFLCVPYVDLFFRINTLAPASNSNYLGPGGALGARC